VARSFTTEMKTGTLIISPLENNLTNFGFSASDQQCWMLATLKIMWTVMLCITGSNTFSFLS